MCLRNPRNCALHDNHRGTCLSQLDLDKAVKRDTEILLLHDLNQDPEVPDD